MKISAFLAVTACALSPSPAKDDWPVVERLELELDLRHPPELSATARLDLTGVESKRFTLVLNRALSVTRAEALDGRAVRFRRGPSLMAPFHKEGRRWRFALDEPPQDGRLSLSLDWSGEGEDGTGDRDWRGILLLAPDELRMSEQTIFYPQVPTQLDGPGIQRSPASVRVLAPAGLEVFVAGTPLGAAPVEGGRAWSFELERPAALSVVAAEYERTESSTGGVRITSLLFAEHADIGDELTDASRRALRFFSSRFGPSRDSTLGVCEMRGRGSSYNWASDGLIVFERGALRSGVPVAKLGHEVAHLWWGQTVRASGAGERFLTEGLAEYSSWRFIEDESGAAAGRSAALAGLRSYLDGVHAAGADAALAETTFQTPAYSALAYHKGALVLRHAEKTLGRAAFDTALTSYVRELAGKSPDVTAFLRRIEESTGAGLDLPWIEQAGHLHLALSEVTHDPRSGTVRGTIKRAECPAGIPVLDAGSVELLVRTRDLVARVRVPLAGETTGFEVQHPEPPELVQLDPDVTLPLDSALFTSGGARLMRSDPEDGATVPDGGSRIVLSFDRALAPVGHAERRKLRSAIFEASRASDDRYALRIRGAELDETGRVLSLETEPFIPGRTFIIPLAEVLTDELGIPVEAEALRFQTAPLDDAAPPTVIRFEPPHDARDVETEIRQLRITFSERMRSGRGYGTPTVKELEQRGFEFPPLGDSHWEDDDSVLVYSLREPLAPDTRYALPFGHLFRDWNGNSLARQDYSFRTAGEDR